LGWKGKRPGSKKAQSSRLNAEGSKLKAESTSFPPNIEQRYSSIGPSALRSSFRYPIPKCSCNGPVRQDVLIAIMEFWVMR
jgi:hypothetical protein